MSSLFYICGHSSKRSLCVIFFPPPGHYRFPHVLYGARTTTTITFLQCYILSWASPIDIQYTKTTPPDPQITIQEGERVIYSWVSFPSLQGNAESSWAPLVMTGSMMGHQHTQEVVGTSTGAVVVGEPVWYIGSSWKHLRWLLGRWRSPCCYVTVAVLIPIAPGDITRAPMTDWLSGRAALSL